MTQQQRPRILLITRNLPPLVGGMERLNWHLAEELALRGEVRIIGPEGSAALAPHGIHVREIPLKPLPRFLLAAFWATWRTSRTWQPHIVLAGSGLTAPLAWLSARACGAFSAVYVHGLDMAIRHPLYRALWLPAIRRMDRVIANSSVTAKLAIDAGVNAGRIEIVHPGVTLPADAAKAGDIEQFRTDQRLGDAPVLLSVGRLSQRKGLREFVTNVMPHIVASKPDVLLLIVGAAPAQALYAEPQTPESIQAAGDALDIGEHLRFLGVITDRERLAMVYRTADVHVFPIQQIPGDPEGFGMVAIEAAAYGLPTVAYAAGGVVDAVAEGESGHLVPPGDSAAFAASVLQLLKHPIPPAQLRSHAEQFAWPRFGRKIAEALDLETHTEGMSSEAGHKLMP